MTRNELARLLDHSVLKPEATVRDVLAGASIVVDHRIGFYCVQPCWVREATAALQGSHAQVVAVIGFPHGCEDTAVKVLAATRAVADGARELDMVLNVGALRSGLDELVESDIASVVRAGGVPVKVILECATLDDDQKRRACAIVVEAGGAFVKTSTGFHAAGGATVADVRLLRACVGDAGGVKAAGGIRSLADALAMLDAGANRLGTSASVAILSEVDHRGTADPPRDQRS